jgi:hypothetical protein
MLALPPVAPQVGWRNATRLARDHYIRLDSNDYSVHPGVIGWRIEVTADLHRVQVFCDGKTVADHERVWAWHQTITDTEHRAAAALRPVREHDDQLRVEQRSVVLHEIAHHFGISDERLIELDRY